MKTFNINDNPYCRFPFSQDNLIPVHWVYGCIPVPVYIRGQEYTDKVYYLVRPENIKRIPGGRLHITHIGVRSEIMTGWESYPCTAGMSLLTQQYTDYIIPFLERSLRSKTELICSHQGREHVYTPEELRVVTPKERLTAMDRTRRMAPDKGVRQINGAPQYKELTPYAHWVHEKASMVATRRY